MDAPDASPAIASIRVDWLLDVARRLSAVGLERLRALEPGDPWTIEDEVDGGIWRLEGFRASEPWRTQVELECDVVGPSDDARRPELRAGFALLPWWDDAAGGRCLRARVEVGPRGPVTFDPENWMALLPAEPAPGVDSSAPEGVVRGSGWTFAEPRATDALQPASVDDAAGMDARLDDLELPSDDRPVPELLLPLRPRQEARRGLFGRRRERSGDPVSRLRVTADGPISVGAGRIPEGWSQLDRVVVEADRLDLGGIPLTGPGLTAVLEGRPGSAAG